MLYAIMIRAWLTVTAGYALCLAVSCRRAWRRFDRLHPDHCVK